MTSNIKNEITAFDSRELSGVEKSKAAQIRAAFEPMAEMLEKLESEFNEILRASEQGITVNVTANAKKLRLAIAKVRIATEKTRKEQKEEYLRAGKAIDGMSNILKWAVIGKENKLKEIECYLENLEKQRQEELKTKRAAELSLYTENISESLLNTLGSMEDEVWNAYLETKKSEHKKNLEINRINALHAKRCDDISEYIQFLPEKMLAENFGEWDAGRWDTFVNHLVEEGRLFDEQLKKKAEEAEKAEKQKKMLEAAKDRERIELLAKLKTEREAREKLEREKREREAAEKAKEKAKKEAEERLIQEKLKEDDAAKIVSLISDLENIQSAYVFDAEKNKRVYFDVCFLIGKIINTLMKNQLPNEGKIS